jgi:peptidoglycan hydrolase CwlO-like protein
MTDIEIEHTIAKLDHHMVTSVEGGFHASALFTKDAIEIIKTLSDIKQNLTTENHGLQRRVTELENHIEEASLVASETHQTWEDRCRAVIAAIGLDFGVSDNNIPDELSVRQIKIDALQSRVDELNNQLDSALPTVESRDASIRSIEEGYDASDLMWIETS